MRAIVATQPGGPEVMDFVERAVPSSGPEELLVRVHATAINRADMRQRTGTYPLPPGSTDVFGLEMAGEVVEAGEAVEGWTAGDRVCALTPGGGHAEYAVVPAVLALPVPPGLGCEEAAALPEAFVTAYDALRQRGGLQSGDRALIHGGASGVGTAAIQLARLWGAEVFVTCRATKRDACLTLGADAAIDYREEDFVARVVDLTGGAGVNLVLDHIGGPYLEHNLDALAMEGRLVVIGTMGGDAATLDLRKVMARRAWVTGSLLRPRTVDEKARLVAAIRQEVWPALADGRLVPVIDRVMPWDEIQDAHRRMENSEHVGKIVLRVAAA